MNLTASINHEIISTCREPNKELMKIGFAVKGLSHN